MKKALFASPVEANGKKFNSYTTRITFTSTGETVSAKVKFRSPCVGPSKDDCPCIIEFDKQDANLTTRRYTTRDGEERTGYVLWITKFKVSDEKYVDHSLDDVE